MECIACISQANYSYNTVTFVRAIQSISSWLSHEWKNEILNRLIKFAVLGDGSVYRACI